METNGVTNLYSRSDSNTPEERKFPVDSDGKRLPNTVDYGPSKEEDSVPVPEKMVNPPQPTTTNPELSVVITSSRKSGDQYLVKAVISGTDGATCSAVMTNGSSSASASSSAGMIEGQYSCMDLSIPM
jgi:hypothetical protein